ncbi:MAG TPA: metallophosphoesterase [Bryobacteraceae bacterium]|jgi:3',5'-cyclic AMP phosphodiesterase CpdA
MPIVVDRRGFLKQTAAAALWAFSKPLCADAPFRVALLSDTHIAADPKDTFRGFFPHANLRKAVDQVSAGQFQMLLVNGDMARLLGKPEDYKAFNSFIDPLAEKIPLVATLGNHDDRKNARAALTRRAGETEAVQQKLVTTIDAGDLRFILLDSLLATNVTPGQLGKSQRNWLTEYLEAQTAKPVVIFVHHQPDPDNDGALVDANRLLEILAPRPAVKALVFGHTHVYSLDKFKDLHLINLPAVGYNFADGNPVGWMEGTFSKQGLDLKLHAFAGETKDDGKSVNLSWR